MGRVLLTGATGFVGQAVLRGLLERGLAVTCVLRRGSAARLGENAARVLVIESEDIFLETPEWWAGACRDCDTVLHLAWYSEPGKYLTSDKNMDCLSGTLALAQGAMRAGVRRLVGVGTCFEYDLTLGQLDIETPLDPQTPYAAAKAACYLALSGWVPQAGGSFLWARLFYLHGRGEDSRRLVPYLHQQMQAGQVAELTSGSQIRDFMDVDDAAALLISDALSSRTGASNIASGKGITVRALAESIADQYDRRDLLKFGARPDNLTDPPCVVGLRPQEEAQ